MAVSVLNKQGKDTIGTMERFTWDKIQFAHPADTFPEALYVELSSRCNFSCRGCFREGFREDVGDMSDSTIDGILQALDQQGAGGEGVRVFLGGIGEPLLHPRFAWFFRQLAARGASVELQTNGSLLTGEVIDLLVDGGLEKLVLSYETGSMGHEAGADFKDTEGAKNFPWNIIKEFQERKKVKGMNRPQIALEWVLTRESLKDMAEFGTAVVAASVDEIILSNFLPLTREGEEEILYSTDYCGHRDQELLAPLLKSIRHRTHYVAPHFTLKTERYCSFIEKESAVIRWDGEVAPCYRFLHDGVERVDGKEMELFAHSFGNLANQSLYGIWNSREYIWFRISVSQSLYPSCTDCSLKEGCEYLRDSSGNCWGMGPSCGNCLWARQIILCP